MARIAFILLCHKDPAGVIAQAGKLTSAGDFISIHFDRRAGAAAYAAIRAALAGNPNVTFAKRRIRCGWGEWSLVAATLLAVRAAEEAFPEATHFYMLSGDCMPIKAAEFMHDRLDEDDADFIESFDFHESGWIRTGIKEERLVYRHFFNERTQKWLFYRSFRLQRWLGLRRATPTDMKIMIGSQWWCLRRRTVERVLAFCDARRDVVRFFRTTWIPDETFFQTIVRHLVPAAEIRSRTLTFLMFTDYGMPVTFYNDHHDLLVGQDFFFARKISAGARELKARLSDLYGRRGQSFAVTNEGRKLHGFLTGRGRVGRRFAPRMWEAGDAIGHGRVLHVIACKKWHVAKRLAAAIRDRTDLPAVDYLFTEEATALPALGGFETTLDKRGRHRRSLLAMLFDHYGRDRLAICLDTADFDLLRDLCDDPCEVRILEVQCDFSDDYLIGHARRVGLAGQATPEAALRTLLPTVRFDVRFESDRLRDAGFPRLFHLREGADLAANARALAAFLSVPDDLARTLATTDHLFAD